MQFGNTSPVIKAATVSILAGTVEIGVTSQQGAADKTAAGVKVSGAPPIDKETLYADNVSFNGASGNSYDITGANTINMYVFEPGVPTICVLSFFTNNGATLVQNIQFVVGAGSIVTVERPAQGDSLEVFFNQITGPVATVGSFSLVGSTRQASERFQAVNGAFTNFTAVTQVDRQNGDYQFTGSLLAGQTGLIHPSFIAGPGQLTIWGAVACSWAVRMANNTSPFMAGSVAAAPATITPNNLYVPGTDLIIAITAGAAAGAITTELVTSQL